MPEQSRPVGRNVSGLMPKRSAITKPLIFSVRRFARSNWRIIMQSALMIPTILLPDFWAAERNSVIKGSLRPWRYFLKLNSGREWANDFNFFGRIQAHDPKSGILPRSYTCGLPRGAKVLPLNRPSDAGRNGRQKGDFRLRHRNSNEANVNITSNNATQPEIILASCGEFFTEV